MNEADVRREVYNSLQGYGYWPIHGRDAILCPNCGHKVLPAVAGRPDLLILDPVGNTKVAEVKVVDIEKSLSYSFNQIEDDQRRWLDAWADHDGMAYLAIGTINESPRRVWVIPWIVWVAIEEIEKAANRLYIPVDLELYKKLPVKGLSVSLAGDTLNQFQLIRVTGSKVQGDKFTGGHWEFPEGHSLIEGKEKLWH